MCRVKIDAETVGRKLLDGKNTLLLTHIRPDGDAIGSTLGLAERLRGRGEARVTVLLPEGIPGKYRLYDDVDYVGAVADYAPYDRIVSIDAAVPARAGFSAAGGVPPEVESRLLVIDHHPDNTGFGAWNHIDPTAAATAEIISGLRLGTIAKSAASWLLLGLMTDTGNFRFANTDGAAMRMGAELLDAGAELTKIVNLLYFNKPLNQQRFEMELLSQQLKIACSGKLAYAAAPDELLKKYNFSLENSEGVIDLVREIAGVVVAALIYRRDGEFRVSLRSKNDAVKVGELARKYGGGGHALAAGMTLKLPDLSAVEELLEREVYQLLKDSKVL